MKVSSVFLTSILLLYSCSQKTPQTKDELLKWVAENEDFTKEATVRGIKAQVSYRPTDLIIAEVARSNTEKEIDSLRKAYQNYYYFTISLSKNKKEALYSIDQSRFSELVQVLSFNMKAHVKVITPDNDEILAKDYIFSRTYGIGTANTLLFVFPSDELKNADSFKLKITEFGFGLGLLSFEFNVSDLERAPELPLENLLL
ncbi:MAG: hypothetical protein AAF843_10370 [Bacteroidota bacterium]